MAFEFGMFHEFQRTVGVSDEEAFAASFEEIDAAERWRLAAMWLAEIHVNPFQVVRKNPSGADELVLEDTLLVPPGVGPDNNLISQQVNVWTRYTD